MKIKRLTWEQLQNSCEILAKQLVDKDVQFGCIVGISRGGCIPASILAHILGMNRLYIVAYKSPLFQEDKAVKQVYPLHQDLKDKSILLVDDVADCCRTIRTVKQELESRGCTVKTLTIHKKDNSNITPDFYLMETDELIEYPWEQ